MYEGVGGEGISRRGVQGAPRSGNIHKLFTQICQVFDKDRQVVLPSSNKLIIIDYEIARQLTKLVLNPR